MTRHLLKFEPEFDFEIIGICCHSKDYRLCWFLNKQMGIALSRSRKPVEILQNKNRSSSKHSLYEYDDEATKIKYELIANRSEEGYVLPEEKRADYLLLIHNNQMFSIEQIVERIRSIQMVLTAYSIEPENLPSKENLLLP